MGSKKRNSKSHKKKVATGHHENSTVIGKVPENVENGQISEGTSNQTKTKKTEESMLKERPGNQENGMMMVKGLPAKRENGKTNIAKGTPENLKCDMTKDQGTSENLENGMTMVKGTPVNTNIVKGTPENLKSNMTKDKGIPDNLENGMIIVKGTPENSENGMTMFKETPVNRENGKTDMVKGTTKKINSDMTIDKGTPENLGDGINMAKRTSQDQENGVIMLKETSENVKKVKESNRIETYPVVRETPKDLARLKHPLENTWGFWLYTNQNKKNWTENQVELTHFDTVEDYWCLYHYMKLPSKLKMGQDYAVFKQGISPMWEDPANKHGGRWMIATDRQPDMDRIWLDVLLLMIGENFEYSETICGAVVNIRGAKSRVTLWTQNKTEKSNMAIGRKLKEELRVSRLQFCVHNSNSALLVV